ncbi:MAG TPA: MarR family transcriptional regulator [Myxococcales bacterium]|nr:MarR family transcriptional regulator [Myxococcales bacterium]
MKASDMQAPSPVKGLGPTLSFMRLLWGLEHELQAASKRMQREIGVTGPQRLALRLIGREPGLSAGQLASTMQLHPSTLTGILDLLVSRKLVERRTDPGDRRRARLRLTRSGLRLDAARNGTVEASVQRALGRCRPSDVEAAKRLLTQLSAGLRRA